MKPLFFAAVQYCNWPKPDDESWHEEACQRVLLLIAALRARYEIDGVSERFRGSLHDTPQISTLPCKPKRGSGRNAECNHVVGR